VIEDEGAAADQAMRIAREGLVLARDGRQVAVDAGTLCLHGDTPRSVAFAWRIRREFEAGGIRIESPPQ
jgi:UPF0271 protein